MRPKHVKERNIRDIFLDIIGDEIKGIALISPDGFIIDYVGDLSSREIGLSSIFNLSIPKAIKEINQKSLSVMNSLLEESSRLEEFYLSTFSFKLGDRTFIGVYIEGFLIIASIDSEAVIENVYRKLLRGIYGFFDYISTLAGKTIPWFFKAASIEVVKAPTKIISKEKSEISVKRKEELQLYMLRLRELIFDTKKDLIEKGDWQTIYNDLNRFKANLEELNKIDAELAKNPVITAIKNWVEKTLSRIKMILDMKGNSIIDEERKNGLRRSLSKAMEHIRIVITKEIEG